MAASISGWDELNPDDPGTGLDSVEHLHFAVPDDGDYLLRVVWRQELFDSSTDPDVNAELFALAWTVTPEPGTLVLVSLGLLVFGRRRH